MGEPLVRKAGILEDETGLHLLPLSMLLTEALGVEFLGWTSKLSERSAKTVGERLEY